MKPTIGLISQGEMGAAIGGRLAAHGLKVLTVLEGRSAASASRAAAAGMTPMTWADMAAVDIFLSVVPPSGAHALAEKLAPHFAASARKPVYADLNAVSPSTVREIDATLAPSGVAFADGGILGGPPRGSDKGPAIFVSGPGAVRIGELQHCGLDIRVMDAPVGAASAVKMSFAGITKGFTAMVSMMILAAARNGASQYLLDELASTAPRLLQQARGAVPRMFDRAYRFAPEMREIADYLADDDAAAQVYPQFARFYERIATDNAGPQELVRALRDFTDPPLRAAE